MSCGCNNNNGGVDSTYGSVCRADIPYPSVSHESVPSLIDNLVTALYGTFTPTPTIPVPYNTKSVVNGKVVWNNACDPNNTTSLAGIPRSTGEGLLCYILRVLENTGISNSVTPDGIQTLTNKTIVSPTLTGSVNLNGATLTGGNFSGITSGIATNLALGSANQIPYQTAENTTSFISAGSTGQLLQANGSSAPGWINSSSASANNAVVIRDSSGNFSANKVTLTGGLTGNVTGNVSGTANALAGGLTGYLPYQSAINSTAFLPPPTLSGSVLTCNTRGQYGWIQNTAVTSSANNVNGGAAGEIVYQTSVGNTGFASVGSAGQLLKSNGVSAPSWINSDTANTANAVVLRDSLGGFSAGSINATLNGAIAGGSIGNLVYQSGASQTSFVSNGTSGQLLSSNGNAAPSWIPTNTNTQGGSVVIRDPAGSFSANVISANGFSGNLTGNVTGTLTGSLSGNATTATTASLASGLSPVPSLTAGTYGSYAQYPIVTITNGGQITGISTYPVTGTSAASFADASKGSSGYSILSGAALFIDTKNFVRVAGSNSVGQLGLGDNNSTTTSAGAFAYAMANFATGEYPVKAYAGALNVFVLTNLGNLYSSGDNVNGICGVGLPSTTNPHIDVLTKVAFPVGATQIVDFSISKVSDAVTGTAPSFTGNGQAFCLAVDSSGKLYSWGNNAYGQLGLNNTTSQTSPQLVTAGAISGKTITKCFAYGFPAFGFVIDSDKNLYGCGYHAGWGNLGLGNNGTGGTRANVSVFTSVGIQADAVYAVGGISATQTMATSFVLYNGKVFAAGAGLFGELGDGTTKDQQANHLSSTFNRVYFSYQTKPVLSISPTTFTGSIAGTTLTVTAITSGALRVGTTITGTGVTSPTTITALGSGSGGNGTYTISRSLTLASRAMTGLDASVTTSTAHGFTTGDNIIITGSSVVQYNGVHSIYVIDANRFNFAVTTSGANDSSVGIVALKGDVSDSKTISALGVSSNVSATTVNNAGSSIVAIVSDAGTSETNVLYTWGYNTDGQLGLRDGIVRATPNKITNGVAGKTFIKAQFAGAPDNGVNLFALTTDNLIYSCGTHGVTAFGDMAGTGNTSAADRTSLVPCTQNGIPFVDFRVYGKSDLVHGGLTMLARSTDGSLYTWGDNTNGQTGTSFSTFIQIPQKVTIG